MPVSVGVIDANGKIVVDQKLQNNSLDISGLQGDMYNGILSSGNMRSVIHFVKP